LSFYYNCSRKKEKKSTGHYESRVNGHRCFELKKGLSIKLLRKCVKPWPPYQCIMLVFGLKHYGGMDKLILVRLKEKGLSVVQSQVRQVVKIQCACV